MPDVVAELIDVFVTDTPLRLGRMRDAVATDDAAMLEQEAHAVKGNASHFGAAELVRACETLEGLARRGDLADADEHLAAVRRADGSGGAAPDPLPGPNRPLP